MPKGAEASPLVVCAGSDCAKDRRKAYRKLVSALDEAGVVCERSPCLGVCHGPVVVVGAGGPTPEVIERLRTRKARNRLLAGLSGRKRPKARGGAAFVTGKRAARAARRAERRPRAR